MQDLTNLPKFSFLVQFLFFFRFHSIPTTPELLLFLKLSDPDTYKMSVQHEGDIWRMLLLLHWLLPFLKARPSPQVYKIIPLPVYSPHSLYFFATPYYSFLFIHLPCLLGGEAMMKRDFVLFIFIFIMQVDKCY